MSAPARVAVVNLMKMILPTMTVCLTDGGFIFWDDNGDGIADGYQSGHPVFGTLASAESLTEGVGDELPGVSISFSPHKSATPAQLSQPGFQGSSVRFWQADYSIAAGVIIGTPELLFDGLVDRTRLRVGREERSLSIDLISAAERLLLKNEGNSMSPTFHKSVFPGEKGHDNATGLSVPVAWGVEASVSSSATTGWDAGWGGGY